MQNYILVSLGAAVGGGLRYWVSNLTLKVLPAYFPYGTLAVNIIGSFLLGLFVFYFQEQELLSSELRLLLTTGFCGGFTTFSTFSLETVLLLKNSEYLLAGMNIAFNLFLCIFFCFLAYMVAKSLIGG